ncbi:unnamed protein product, partial [Meganyctiphanes norvegica]
NMKLFLVCLLVAAAAAECPWGQAECGDGTCINYRYWCDGDEPDCADGSDEAECSTCGEGFVHCDSADICIPQPWVCDGWEDCPGAEDEAMCSTPAPGMCDEGYFECSDGQCIHPLFRCDGEDDCLDGYEDEEQCTECQAGFHCGEDICVSSDFVCDDLEDCHRGEDESSQVAMCECLPGDFECSNGDCIPPDWHCDGFPDCFGGSDEADCTTMAPRVGGPRMTGSQSHFLEKIQKKMAKAARKNTKGKWKNMGRRN